MVDKKLLEKDLSGHVYIVTGANSGTGFATTEQLTKQGAIVVAACRNMEKANKAFSNSKNKDLIDIMKLNLASLESVRNFAEKFNNKYDRLDALVNNAGIMAVPEGKTKDGFELQFGTNHLGHFLLTELLLDVLKKSAPSRIVNVSSVAHVSRGDRIAEINFDDLNWEKREYDRTAAYAQSKLANVLHAVELSKRLKGTGVTAVSLHPGWVRSNLASGIMKGGAFVQNVLMRPFARFLGTMNNFEGAQTTLHCLLDNDIPNHAGEYFSQNARLYPNKEDRAGGWPMESPNPAVKDPEIAKRLYEVSRKLVDL